MVRDIAIFVPESVSGDEVYGLIKSNLGSLCIKSWQFDVFTKEIDGVKKTSYA
jgi:phenylalanyl-tRNA synthetase beta subunit